VYPPLDEWSLKEPLPADTGISRINLQQTANTTASFLAGVSLVQLGGDRIG
jgi:hypothetical protein